MWVATVGAEPPSDLGSSRALISRVLSDSFGNEERCFWVVYGKQCGQLAASYLCFSLRWLECLLLYPELCCPASSVPCAERMLGQGGAVQNKQSLGRLLSSPGCLAAVTSLLLSLQWNWNSNREIFTAVMYAMMEQLQVASNIQANQSVEVDRLSVMHRAWCLMHCAGAASCA